MSVFDTTGAEVCRRCGENARAEIERLQAENSELREQGERLFDKTLELGTENSQLRELVAEIWPIAEYAGYEHELSRARELMRELGYEED